MAGGSTGTANADEDAVMDQAWSDLRAHQREAGKLSLRTLLSGDVGVARAEAMSIVADELRLDYSRHLATEETLALLVRLARAAGLEERRDAMLRGARINSTEGRSVLHAALRMVVDVDGHPAVQELVVDGLDVLAGVRAVLGRMGELAESIRSGEWRGFTGRQIRNVVNIGIGGSSLGPEMASRSLADYSDPRMRFRFVSNLDPAALDSVTRNLDPAETLFVVCSKTFTTLETLTNAAAARRWLLSGLGAGMEAVARHFIAVSTNAQEVARFGIDTANMLEFWDWVGGRYSLDSAIGFSLMVAIGRDGFEEMLRGFRLMDLHFAEAPLEENMPVIQGLLNVWYDDFFGAQSHAVLPYSDRLGRFPAYLQQLMMESNGKSVRLDGSRVAEDTGEIYWGEPGTDGQHAFYQLLHQGTKLVPADLILFVNPTAGDGHAHDLLFANGLAQAAVLALGRSPEEVAAEGVGADLVPHKVMPGNRPSSVIVAPKLTPRVLGELIALYEHTAFVEGAIWGIDSFDQWGVELGKAMASRLAPELERAVAHHGRRQGAAGGAPPSGVDIGGEGAQGRELDAATRQAVALFADLRRD